ncbi:hypothetical protein JDV02_009467 [Purpureocillium takamizusanense]|uniref:Noranthrone monooxygenase n=1 Tax=Purpureocillium takamizusanense TaxID=2060973 RepID=A0A9Q8VE98_9HYPO|nr:uncharacterized protein JDV02_009467 [Purpureocillium takamizusanense]UNI23660.1 hypothetical protein JDV02_009467 [Purpureocillium takamizusanense]
MQFSGPTLVAVATGIVGSAWASGVITSLTLISIPSAKAVPEKAVAFWADLFARGAALMPKAGATVALAYAYVAYDVRCAGGQWQLFAAAAASVMGIVPFTLLVMADTNDKLHKLHKDGTSGSEHHAKELLDRWGTMNFVRGLMPLAGSILGFKAYLDNSHW